METAIIPAPAPSRGDGPSPALLITLSITHINEVARRVNH